MDGGLLWQHLHALKSLCCFAKEINQIIKILRCKTLFGARSFSVIWTLNKLSKTSIVVPAKFPNVFAGVRPEELLRPKGVSPTVSPVTPDNEFKECHLNISIRRKESEKFLSFTFSSRRWIKFCFTKVDVLMRFEIIDAKVFLRMGHSRPLFLYFCIFYCTISR